MMRRAVSSAILALAVALTLGAADPKAKQEPSAVRPAPSQRPAEARAADPEGGAGAADPLKLASPNPASAKVPSGSFVDRKTFIIGPEDVLGINVIGQKDLSLPACLVRPDGMISVPYINEVEAAGRTPSQLENDIAAKLKTIIKEPVVNVQVVAVHSRKYRIQGEVNKPGEWDLIRPTTVLEALVNAGGFREWADEKRIRVLRNGGRQVFKFNYKEVINGKKLEQNILLEPDDIIVVK